MKKGIVEKGVSISENCSSQIYAMSWYAARPDGSAKVKLTFVTKSGSVATFGTFKSVTLHDLRRYVLQNPIHWVAA